MDHGFPTTTTHEEQERNAPIAVLPVGSYEQHGQFLPLSTDTVIANILAREISTKYDLMLLPPITISCSHEHAGWRGTVSISARTLYGIITDIAESLRLSGVEKLLIVSGHGGNYVLSNVVQEASVTGATMALFPGSQDWTEGREAAHLSVLTNHADMHAGELETSLLLWADPLLVGDGFETSNHSASERRHLLTLGMKAYTENGVVGSPSFASAEKGGLLLKHLTRAAKSYIDVLNGSPANREV